MAARPPAGSVPVAQTGTAASVGNFLDWMETALDKLCNLDEGPAAAGSGSKKPLPAPAPPQPPPRGIPAAVAAGGFDDASSGDGSGAAAAPHNDLQAELEGYFHHAWLRGGGVAATHAAGQLAKRSLRVGTGEPVALEVCGGSLSVKDSGCGPSLLEPSLQEVARHLTLLPEVVDLDECGEFSFDKSRHPLGDVIAAVVADMDAAEVGCRGAHTAYNALSLGKASLAALATVAAEACRDTTDFITQVHGHVPLRKLDVRGMSYLAGDGVVQAARALSQLRSEHRQAVLFLSSHALRTLKTCERSAVMCVDDGDTLLEVCTPSCSTLSPMRVLFPVGCQLSCLPSAPPPPRSQIRETVGACIRQLNASTNDALRLVGLCHSHAVPPLQMRLCSNSNALRRPVAAH